MQTVSGQQQNSAKALHGMATETAVLKKLLVAYDFSKASEIALRYATEIARRFGSEIVLAHIETPEMLGDKMDAGAAKAKLEQLTEQHDVDLLANRLRSEGIKVSYVTRSGAATDLLVQLVSECKADLLLMGAYGYHAADRITLGSTAEYLLRSLSCPVLVVGPSVVDPPTCGIRLSEIVYASSCPTAPGPAPSLACELARKFATHIHIVHVEPEEACGPLKGSRRKLEMQEETIADHFRRRGVGSSWTVQFGSQQDRLLDQAKVVSADLLCFGIVHPPTDPSQMGVLSSIIRAARCPILTVPGPA